MAVYSISAGPLGYVYLAEVSTVLLRAKTISVALVVNQLQQFFGTYAVPYMLNGKNFGITGTGKYLLAAIVDCLSCLFRWRSCHRMGFGLLIHPVRCPDDKG